VRRGRDEASRGSRPAGGSLALSSRPIESHARSRYLPRLVSCRRLLLPSHSHPQSSVSSRPPHTPPLSLRPRFPAGSPISRASAAVRRRRWRLPWSTPSTCARSTGRAATSAPSSPTRDAPRSCSASHGMMLELMT